MSQLRVNIIKHVRHLDVRVTQAKEPQKTIIRMKAESAINFLNR